MSLLLRGLALIAISLINLTNAQTISQIQGSTFLSPLAGQRVSNVQGLVVAKGPQGFFLSSPPSSDTTNTSNSTGINIFTTSASIRAQVNVGDFISLSGLVSEFRSSTAPLDLKSTEIGSPTNITILSSNNTITSLVLGSTPALSPPTKEYTSLDNGNVFGVPNNVSSLDGVNPVLEPGKYGLDFWESLEGQLVTVKNPVALGFNVNSFGDFWVRGDWSVTGLNGRGGLTMSVDEKGIVDANPEAIVINSPALDGTPMPSPTAGPNGLRMGATLSDITGILTYSFDTFRILPLTAPTVLSAPPYDPPPSSFISSSSSSSQRSNSADKDKNKDGCTEIVIGQYNVENLSPRVAHLPVIAQHIVEFLGAPDLMFLEEIEDNSGEGDDGTVAADMTLDTLVEAIRNVSLSLGVGGNVSYAWAEVDPIDGLSGGVPGGNIRNAFLYKPDVMELINPNQGSANDSAVVLGTGKKATLNFNPSVIDPTNPAFTSSRKPLVAHFRLKANNESFWAINVHQSSKDGSSSLHGDPRPPINGAVNNRIAQANVEANFASSILTANPHANLILAGDFNDFLFTTPVFAPFKSAGLRDMDEVVGKVKEERYTYVFDMEAQQLDHMLVSENLVAKGVVRGYEHVHVNTWAETVPLRGSDHDPSVGLFRICAERGSY